MDEWSGSKGEGIAMSVRKGGKKKRERGGLYKPA